MGFSDYFPARHCDPTTEEEKRIIHEVFVREIYSYKYWVMWFARLGSKVCRKMAEEKGWHKGEWHDGKIKAMLGEPKITPKEYYKQYYWKDHAKSLERNRLYREKIRAERAALKKAKEKEV